jgi:hypothetical protein
VNQRPVGGLLLEVTLPRGGVSGVTIAWINRIVICKMREEVERRALFETGGSLFGYWGPTSEAVVIGEYVGPGPNAKHARFSFKPDWHSHPGGSLTLSWRDRRTLFTIATFAPARTPYPLMALIAGPPWKMRLWKAQKLKKDSWSVSCSECELKEYE